MKKYKVELGFVIHEREDEEFEIEAKDEKEALEKAKEESFNYKYNFDCELVDWYVEEVKDED